MRLLSIIFVIIAFAGCQKSDNQLASHHYSVNSVKDSFYFKGQLNGTDILWIVPSHKNDTSFIYQAGASEGYSDLSNECSEGHCFYLVASTQIYWNVANVRPQMNVAFNMATSSRSREEYLSWFAPGTKIYQTSVRQSKITDLLDPAKNGLVVFYIDQNGNTWSSNRGNQQGSSFESISLNDEIRTDVPSQKVWKARFSCTLYDDYGNTMQLKNAEIYGPVLLP